MISIIMFALLEGFQVHVVGGDGNCQFLAISHQLHIQLNIDKSHAVVREEICQYMSGHQDEFAEVAIPEEFVNEGNVGPLPEVDLVTFIADMKLNGTSGDHLTLMAAANLYRYVINLFPSDGCGEYCVSLLTFIL